MSLQDIIRVYKLQPSAAVLATVVNTAGSVYRRPGARMLIAGDRRVGSISGGCLENDICDRARSVLESGKPLLVTYDAIANEEILWGLGIGCNGKVQILIEALAAQNPLEFIAACLEQRQSGVLATVFDSGSMTDAVGTHLELYPDGRIVHNLSDDALVESVRSDAYTALQSGKSSVRSYLTDTVEVLLEVIHPPTPLIIFGAGQDAVPVANFAKAIGWQVTIVDRRSTYATQDRFPMADITLVTRPEEGLDHLPLTPQTVAVIMTHNYFDDRELLKSLLPSSVCYVGLLGPRHRTERLLQELHDDGIHFTDAQTERFYAPIGLDIGADTPEEIALAVVSEIQKVLTNRSGRSLKGQTAPLHPRIDSTSFNSVSVDGATIPQRTTSQTGLLILAAGASTRLGKPKQLLQHQGQSFLRRTATMAVASGCQPVIVVVGAQAEQMRAEISDLPVIIVENRDWAIGISASIRVGLEALQMQIQSLEAALIMLCDQPWVSVSLIQQLIQQYKLTDKRIVASQYAETMGVPALFDRTLFPELMRLNGDIGAKALLHQFAQDVVPVLFPEGAIDIDTPQDYEQFLQVNQEKNSFLNANQESVLQTLKVDRNDDRS